MILKRITDFFYGYVFLWICWRTLKGSAHDLFMITFLGLMSLLWWMSKDRHECHTVRSNQMKTHVSCIHGSCQSCDLKGTSMARFCILHNVWKSVITGLTLVIDNQNYLYTWRIWSWKGNASPCLKLLSPSSVWQLDRKAASKSDTTWRRKHPFRLVRHQIY